MRSWGGIDGHDRGDDRGLDFASNETMIALARGHDRASIVVLRERRQPFDED